MTFHAPAPAHLKRPLQFALLVLLALAGVLRVHAQASPAAGSGVGPSRLDLYGGYSYFKPFNSDINNRSYQTVNRGADFSAAGWFNKNFGLQLEGTYSPKGPQDNECVSTAQAGPIVRITKGRFVPFFHALGGAAKIGGPAQQTCSIWGWGVTGGFGVDYVLPFLSNRIAVRPVQADFQYSQVNNGPLYAPAGVIGGFGEIYAVHLSAGLVVRIGGAQAAAGETPTLNCTAEPFSVFAGDPVTLSASELGVGSLHDLAYRWTTSGGRINGDGPTVTIDTTGLNAGNYSVSGRLVRGLHARELASCTASFAVLDPAPPTISCSADRRAINSGDPVTITSVASSPQGRPLQYSYSTTSGQVTGNGTTAALNTAGTTPGTITVTCTVADDKGKSASATASVVVATPEPAAPRAEAQNLCSLSFTRDRRRPDRVDNEAKGCLDDIALTLNRSPDAKLLIVGHHGTGERDQDAANRVLNVADYLTREKGIDGGRLDLRISDTPGQTVDDTLLPAGAVTNPGDGASFDRSSVKRVGQPYGVPGAHREAVRRHRRARRRRAAAAAAASPAPSQ